MEINCNEFRCEWIFSFPPEVDIGEMISVCNKILAMPGFVSYRYTGENFNEVRMSGFLRRHLYLSISYAHIDILVFIAKQNLTPSFPYPISSPLNNNSCPKSNRVRLRPKEGCHRCHPSCHCHTRLCHGFHRLIITNRNSFT